MNAFNVPGFAPFPQRKLDKAALNAFPGKEFPARFRDIPQGVRLITLYGFFPRNTPYRTEGGPVQIIETGDTLEIIKRAELRFSFCPAPGFPPLVTRLPSFPACHSIFPALS